MPLNNIFLFNPRGSNVISIFVRHGARLREAATTGCCGRANSQISRLPRCGAKAVRIVVFFSHSVVLTANQLG